MYSRFFHDVASTHKTTSMTSFWSHCSQRRPVGISGTRVPHCDHLAEHEIQCTLLVSLLLINHPPSPSFLRLRNTDAMQEAPVLSKKQQKGTVASKSKKTVLKQSLLTPYKLDWPFLDPDDHDTVFETVSRVLQGIMAKRKRPWVETTTGTVVEDMPEVKKRKNARSQLVCGLNEVIKNLERDRLRCFVVCQSAIPILPSKPLLLLSATRNCPGVCLNNFSDQMAKIFRFGSLAFGIKKPTADDVHVPELEEIVKVITEKSQAIKLPWLPEPEEIESCDKTKPDTESTETEKQITFEYQAANIGQIQPNPNKKRKKAKKGNKT